ncbi:hypothetical protein J7T55_005954 [Diaporthe amygdali]|uniref:uncharacterized protein n=1 Tax=Phomopsis amygdali TaxID=1214568 RepID=UPI0022FDDE8C|nr:uncharacterized protein J7T55_005954 [Diaporthe amygdali]KAJ0124615.1 hypothetical protein J7T55_005954 [Diaporthe amygdali]
MEPQNEHVAAPASTQPIYYLPLETPQTIRLIHARRLSADGRIIIKLKHFSLFEAQYPRFTAISYVWGEKKLHPQKVVINGLSNGLHRWRLWGTLYQRAFRTLVWLGEDTPEVRGALDLLKLFASNSSNSRDEWSWAGQGPISPEKWQALRHWMRRPWWTRVWTLQEFLLPQSLSFYCGNQSITRSDWGRAITTIYNYSTVSRISFESLIDHKGFGNQWARRRLLAYYKHSTMGLVALMAYIGHHEATDDRDRVYAVLGICNDTDRAIVGTPDYTISVEELYTRIVVGFMHQHKSLNILCHRALFTKPHPSSEEPGRRTPTWVPDWRCWTDAASRPVPSMVSEPSRPEIGNFHEIRDPQHGVVDPNLVYAASAGLPAEFSVSADSRRLTCKGIVIDIIDGLGPVGQRGPGGRLYGYLNSTLIQSTSDANTTCLGPGSDPGQQPAGSRAASLTILESLVRSLSLDRAGRYLMWPADVDGYVHQLRNALLGPALAAPWNDVGRFVAANNELCVLRASVSEHLQLVGPPPDPIPAANTLYGELRNAHVPVILRRSAGTEEYEVVGEAFMPGFMKGEAIDGNKTPSIITLL